ncbi:lysosomal amino acid transporter 1 homolog [Dreissena polymorpha]|uniref:PQ-loop repeat-containing protein 2 n=1 Tax=Dreissena polymorpha TaxID=45954 RepID=A0A9D4JVT3_DREPO|nr:lysosomal amino acid transporter 1 homolog [Dreissena polymorpha]XP_052286407.1 lysosomal amino acid transporter 1 homolog [Dreissena polymorpha]KAH3822172.1 hypothetical protein DPMN_123943 [Dreissena polymorpha]
MPWQPLLNHWQAGINSNSSDCSGDYIHWIYLILNDCVYDAKGVASEVLGLASLGTWMVVSIPQMVKNCRHIQGIEGISFMLILMWTLGDSSNLIGSILTKQLKLQIYLAIYFVFADLILFVQYLYYNFHWKKKHRGYESIPATSPLPLNSGTGSQMVLCVSGALLMCVHHSLWVLDSLPYQTEVRLNPAGRSLLATELGSSIFNTVEEKVGYAIGVGSSICYVFSRVAQMFKNYKRKSTDGLSVMMFILAVFGNVTYGLSILVRQQDANYLVKHLPWLIGSLGVVFLDSALLSQFIYYGTKGDFNDLLKQPLLNGPTDADADLEVRVTSAVSINAD